LSLAMQPVAGIDAPNLSFYPELDRRFALLRHHPDFDSLSHAYSVRVIAVSEAEPLFSRISSTEARYLAANAIVAQYYRRAHRLGVEGLSFNEVYSSALDGTGMGSRNRVKGLVGAIEAAGMATIATSQVDRRSRIFKITEKGHATIIELLHASLVVADKILGTAHASRALLRDQAFIAQHYENEVLCHVALGPYSDLFPGYDRLFESTAGPELLRLFWIAAGRGGVLKPQLIEFSSAHAAGKLGVSRVQMRRLLQVCTEMELVRPDFDYHNTLFVTEKFLNHFRDVRAVEMALISLAADKAAQGVRLS
jgi:hypothetical protein